ncbi:MAG TPA: arginine--tRNA ligase [Candidatus Bathyarchaeia archaeon]|nr:arginine--tRNA ligase [Candidatus Bathyarchaeia archaeon]
MFLEFKKEVERVLKEALEKASYEYEGIDLEESEHADLASRIAFSLAQVCNKPPAIIAEDIVKHLEIPAGDTLIADAVAVGPYINFFVNEVFLRKTLQDIIGGIETSDGKKGKIILEHTSANPDGPLHIGHLRNAIIGDVLVRVLERAGYEVETQYYLNDMGRQIAVVVWGAERLAYDETKKADHAVADVYIAANRMLEENSELLDEVGELMRRYEAGDTEVVQKYEAAVQKCLSGIQDSFKRLNIQRVDFVWESEFARSGAVKGVIEELKQKGDIKREGTALLLQLEGIEKALVIQRTDGTSLYTTRDLAYHRWKGKNCDRVIDVFGKDHELVSQQLAKALELLGVTAPEFVIFAFVSLPSGSLSTRAGRYISADELMEKIEERAYTEVDKRRSDLDESKKREIARKVGIGALRYDMVKVSPDKHIVFDFDDALDIEKKGAPFIQYSHARACSILRAEKGYAVSEDYDASLLKEKSEIELIRKLSKLDHIVEDASANLKVHQVAKYARELAESFNLFYKDCPVLTAEAELRKSRLALVECARIVLRDVLAVLGIEAPDEM